MESRMRLAILGGSFDPPHIGHLYLAEVLSVECGYDKVLFVPANHPAHKKIQSHVTAEQRVEMVRHCLEDLDKFDVEDCEIRRGGVSNSIDTVHYIKDSHPGLEGKPALLIGDDLLEGFSEWKDVDQLMEEAEIVVAKRESAFPKAVSFPHTYLDNLIVPVSSTEIRSRVSRGKAFRYLVTDKIYSYIVHNNLYVD